MAAVALVFELGLSLAQMIFTVAFLGFVDESKGRAVTANLVGKGLIALCVALAVVPALTTLFVVWRRYFSSEPFADLKFGLFTPVIAMVACGTACAALIFLTKSIGYRG